MRISSCLQATSGPSANLPYWPTLRMSWTMLPHKNIGSTFSLGFKTNLARFQSSIALNFSSLLIPMNVVLKCSENKRVESIADIVKSISSTSLLDRFSNATNVPSDGETTIRMTWKDTLAPSSWTTLQTTWVSTPPPLVSWSAWTWPTTCSVRLVTGSLG